MNNLFGLLLILSVLGCKRESDLPPLHPDEFTAEQREQLGLRLSEAIFTDNADFPIRAIADQQDFNLYDYLQKIYDQATYFHHFNAQVSPDNRWSPNRIWKIHLVDREDAFSFTLPGGVHFISAGMLKKIEGSDQLFALLALEATRMQERYLFYKFIEKFSTNRVLEMIDRGGQGNGITENDFIEEILLAEYDPETAQHLDASALHHICESSIFNPEALANIDELFQENFPAWISRKSYSGRGAYINNIIETMGGACGTRGDQGDYQVFVLDNL